jgi:glycosyltransferase involved in cell wall biosynthesis
MKVLWLASWYPSKNDALTGDFFQRHANAASKVCTIHVIHIKRDDAISSLKEVSVFTYNNLTETVVLYKPFIRIIPGLHNSVSFLTWLFLMNKYVKTYIKKNGKSDLIHVKAAWKSGLTAWWFNKKYKIPYFVSEQYTGYFDEAKNLVPTFNFIEQFWLKKIFRNAAKVLPVSNYLGLSLKKKFGINYTVLDNIINTEIFKLSKSFDKQSTFTLLHVSLLNLQKNPDVIFEACKILIDKKVDFVLWLVAPQSIAAIYLEKYPETKTHIKLLPETNQVELASTMQKADALLFPSAFESFGLVAYEAIACGTPVVLSNIEVFTNKLEGKPFVKFCDVNNGASLASSIMNLIETKEAFDKEAMHQYVKENFSEESITKQFGKIYGIN